MSGHAKNGKAPKTWEERYSGGLINSQGHGGPWYATKADAYRAIRAVAAERAAQYLLACDQMIEAADAEAP